MGGAGRTVPQLGNEVKKVRWMANRNRAGGGVKGWYLSELEMP